MALRLADLRWEWPQVDLGPVLGSPWLIAIGASAIGLLLLEALLERRTFALLRR
jgi:hypothetical protein